ncbi:MAG: lysozyme inhibitor LprI family protein [Sphingomonadales bacterium]
MRYVTGTLLAFCLVAGLSMTVTADPVDGPPPDMAPAADPATSPPPGAAPVEAQPEAPPPPPPPPPKPKPKPRPASFECRDAFEESEKLICKSFELAKLDQQMVRAFDAYMDSLGPDQGLAAQSAELAQRRFLIDRNKCYDADCIRSVYGERIRVLRGQTSNNRALR